MSKRICILGLTISGNRGAESMLLSIMQEMRAQLGSDCTFDLVSVYPSEDETQNAFQGLTVVNGKPVLILLAAVLSTLFFPLRALSPVRSLLKKNPVLRSIMRCDLVLDSSGVAFIDGRGIPLLMYNTCLCLPALMIGRPMVKLAQAVGPFKTSLNRAIAWQVLSRLGAVIARGEITLSHIQDLGLKNAHLAADTAFVMPVSETDRQKAAEVLGSVGQSSNDRLGISPSTVVDGYLKKLGRNYAAIMADLVLDAVKRNLHVVLIPHSVRPGSASRMNNDLIVCREIIDEIRNKTGRDLVSEGHITLIDMELAAPVLRSLIGSCRYYIASRFHSMVSALATKVPVLLIGWSHKYREVMRMFDLEDYALAFSDVSTERLIKELDRLIASEQPVREKLSAHLPKVQDWARGNFRIAAQVIKGSHS